MTAGVPSSCNLEWSYCYRAGDPYTKDTTDPCGPSLYPTCQTFCQQKIACGGNLTPFSCGTPTNAPYSGYAFAECAGPNTLRCYCKAGSSHQIEVNSNQACITPD